jgi:hypothetical protein
MHRSWARAAAVAVVAAMTIGGGATGAGADDPPGGNVGDRAGAQNNGTSVTGDAQTGGPGSATPPPGADNGSRGPNCTMQDGTPGYLSYEELMVTTQEEQRNDIRAEETPDEPGRWLHVSCGGEYVGLQFFPDGVPVVNPWELARSVTITPPAPVIHTSPGQDDHLVGMTAWFWVDTWEPVVDGTSAGGVTVTVRALPTTLTIDPGDGTGKFTCVDPQPYIPGGTSSCTHVYQRAANVTATATLTYQTSFTSNVGANGALGPIQATSSSQFTVSEAQAINT